MIDIISRSDVAASLLEHTPSLALARRRQGVEHRDLAAWCRARLRRGGWLDGEHPPAWKRAVAHVVGIEDFLRACSGTHGRRREITDVLTAAEIAESVRVGGLGALVKLAEDPSHYEAYVRRAVVRSDYLTSVRAGEVPAWERAFAMVVFTQDILRWLDGRTRGGLAYRGTMDEPVLGPTSNPDGIAAWRLPYIPPEEPAIPREVDSAAWQREAAELAGYSFDASQRNGGFGGHDPNYELDNPVDVPPEERPRLKAAMRVRGPMAFLSVEGCDARPDVAWYHGGSAFELGLSSNFDAQVTALVNGGASGGSGSSPDGPSVEMQKAARQQKIVRRQLAKLPLHAQVVLEIAYTDRTYPTQMVAEYGEGTVALVWRAQQLAGEGTVGPKTLEILVRVAQVDWPTYRKVVKTKGSKRGAALRKAARLAAELILWTAHFRYGNDWKPPVRQGKPPPPLHVADKKLVQAGSKGRKRRKLVECRRAA